MVLMCGYLVKDKNNVDVADKVENKKDNFTSEYSGFQIVHQRPLRELSILPGPASLHQINSYSLKDSVHGDQPDIKYVNFHRLSAGAGQRHKPRETSHERKCNTASNTEIESLVRKCQAHGESCPFETCTGLKAGSKVVNGLFHLNRKYAAEESNEPCITKQCDQPASKKNTNYEQSSVVTDLQGQKSANIYDKELNSSSDNYRKRKREGSLKKKAPESHVCSKCLTSFKDDVSLDYHKLFETCSEHNSSSIGNSFIKKKKTNRLYRSIENDSLHPNHNYRNRKKKRSVSSCRKFECNKCFQYFESLEALNDHERVDGRCEKNHLVNDRFQPKRQKILSKHDDTIIKDVRECPNCLRSFSNVPNLKRHIRNNVCSIKTGNRFDINAIKKRVHKNANLLIKKDISSKKKKGKFECAICLKTFGWRSSLRRHIRKQSCTSGGRYQCSKCLKVYKAKSSLRRHMKLKCDTDQRMDEQDSDEQDNISEEFSDSEITTTSSVSFLCSERDITRSPQPGLKHVSTMKSRQEACKPDMLDHGDPDSKSTAELSKYALQTRYDLNESNFDVPSGSKTRSGRVSKPRITFDAMVMSSVPNFYKKSANIKTNTTCNVKPDVSSSDQENRLKCNYIKPADHVSSSDKEIVVGNGFSTVNEVLTSRHDHTLTKDVRECPNCLKCFSNVHNLRRHIRNNVCSIKTGDRLDSLKTDKKKRHKCHLKPVGEVPSSDEAVVEPSKYEQQTRYDLNESNFDLPSASKTRSGRVSKPRITFDAMVMSSLPNFYKKNMNVKTKQKSNQKPDLPASDQENRRKCNIKSAGNVSSSDGEIVVEPSKYELQTRYDLNESNFDLPSSSKTRSGRVSKPRISIDAMIMSSFPNFYKNNKPKKRD